MGIRGIMATLLCGALWLAAAGCRSTTEQSVRGSLAAALSGGNGLGYSGGTNRGPEKASVVLGLLQIGAGSIETASASAVALDPSGNIFIGGSYAADTPSGLQVLGYLAKFSASGTP